MRRVRQRIAIVAIFVLGLGGCENVAAFLRSAGSADSPATIEPTPAQLSELERLGNGSYQEKVDLFANIEAARIADANDTNRLRYALALSVLGHPSTDLPGAFSELSALLGADNELSLSQSQFATVVMRNVEHMLILSAENDQLRGSVTQLESSRSASTSQADARLQTLRRQLRDAEESNQRLQAELDEARRQLDAILSIETSTDRNN